METRAPPTLLSTLRKLEASPALQMDAWRDPPPNLEAMSHVSTTLFYDVRQHTDRLRLLAALVFYRLEWELRFQPVEGDAAKFLEAEEALFPLDKSMMAAWERLLGDARTRAAHVTYPTLDGLSEPRRLNLGWRLVYAQTLCVWFESQLLANAAYGTLAAGRDALRVVRALADALQNGMPELRRFVGFRPGLIIEWSPEADLLEEATYDAGASYPLLLEIWILALIEARIHRLWRIESGNFSYPGMPASLATSYSLLWRPQAVRDYVRDDLSRLGMGLLANPLDSTHAARYSLRRASEAKSLLERAQRQLSESLVSEGRRDEEEARLSREQESAQAGEGFGGADEEAEREEIVKAARQETERLTAEAEAALRESERLAASAVRARVDVDVSRDFFLRGPAADTWQVVAANVAVLADSLRIARAAFRAQLSDNTPSSLGAGRYLPDEQPVPAMQDLSRRVLGPEGKMEPLDLPMRMGKREGTRRELAPAQGRVRTRHARLLEVRALVKVASVGRVMRVFRRLADAFAELTDEPATVASRRRTAYARLFGTGPGETREDVATRLSLALSHDAWLPQARAFAMAQLTSQPKAQQLVSAILSYRILLLLTSHGRSLALRSRSKLLAEARRILELTTALESTEEPLEEPKTATETEESRKSREERRKSREERLKTAEEAKAFLETEEPAFLEKAVVQEWILRDLVERDIGEGELDASVMGPAGVPTPEARQANREAEGFTPLMLETLRRVLPSGATLVGWLQEEDVMRREKMPRIRLEARLSLLYFDLESEAPRAHASQRSLLLAPGAPSGTLLSANANVTTKAVEQLQALKMGVAEAGSVPTAMWNWLPALGSEASFLPGPAWELSASEQAQAADVDFYPRSAALYSLGQPPSDLTVGLREASTPELARAHDTLRVIKLITACCLQVISALENTKIRRVSKRRETELDMRKHAEEVGEAMLLLRETQARLERLVFEHARRGLEMAFGTMTSKEEKRAREEEAKGAGSWSLTGSDMRALEVASSSCLRGLWLLVQVTKKGAPPKMDPIVRPKRVRTWARALSDLCGVRLSAREAHVYASGATISKARTALSEEEFRQLGLVSLQEGALELAEKNAARTSREGAALYADALAVVEERARTLLQEQNREARSLEIEAAVKREAARRRGHKGEEEEEEEEERGTRVSELIEEDIEEEEEEDLEQETAELREVRELMGTRMDRRELEARALGLRKLLLTRFVRFYLLERLRIPDSKDAADLVSYREMRALLLAGDVSHRPHLAALRRRLSQSFDSTHGEAGLFAAVAFALLEPETGQTASAWLEAALAMERAKREQALDPSKTEPARRAHARLHNRTVRRLDMLNPRFSEWQRARFASAAQTMARAEEESFSEGLPSPGSMYYAYLVLLSIVPRDLDGRPLPGPTQLSDPVPESEASALAIGQEAASGFSREQQDLLELWEELVGLETVQGKGELAPEEVRERQRAEMEIQMEPWMRSRLELLAEADYSAKELAPLLQGDEVWRQLRDVSPRSLADLHARELFLLRLWHAKRDLRPTEAETLALGALHTLEPAPILLSETTEAQRAAARTLLLQCRSLWRTLEPEIETDPAIASAMANLRAVSEQGTEGGLSEIAAFASEDPRDLSAWRSRASQEARTGVRGLAAACALNPRLRDWMPAELAGAEGAARFEDLLFRVLYAEGTLEYDYAGGDPDSELERAYSEGSWRQLVSAPDDDWGRDASLGALRELATHGERDYLLSRLAANAAIAAAAPSTTTTTSASRKRRRPRRPVRGSPLSPSPAPIPGARKRREPPPPSPPHPPSVHETTTTTAPPSAPGVTISTTLPAPQIKQRRIEEEEEEEEEEQEESPGQMPEFPPIQFARGAMPMPAACDVRPHGDDDPLAEILREAEERRARDHMIDSLLQ